MLVKVGFYFTITMTSVDQSTGDIRGYGKQLCGTQRVKPSLNPESHQFKMSACLKNESQKSGLKEGVEYFKKIQ